MDLETLSAAKVRGIFSTRVLREIAQGGSSERLRGLMENVVAGDLATRSCTVADLYDAAFRLCAKSQKVEYVYKNLLVEKLLLGRHSLQTAAALFEMSVAGSKLDALIISKEVNAYEIKTERDELSKLPGQIASYRRAFPTVWVLTCERHAPSVERIAPSSVGVAVLGQRSRIRTVRTAESDPSELDAKAMLSLLRRRELLEFMKGRGLSEEIPNTRVLTTAVNIARDYDVWEINRFVGSKLRERGLSNTSLVRLLPRSMAASALALSLPRNQVERLVQYVNSPLCEALGA